MEAVSESRNSGTRAPLWRVRENETFAETFLLRNQPAVSPMPSASTYTNVSCLDFT